MASHTLGLAWNFFWWPESGGWYAFWSSFGACLTYFAIFAVVYRKLNCHAKGCWRIGLHHVEGTPYITCRHHHPAGGAPTAEKIRNAHEAHRRQTAAATPGTPGTPGS
jgi:hypothetical protein